MNARTTNRISAPLVAVALSFGIAACGSSDGVATDVSPGDASDETSSADITVTDAWVREPADGQTRAAGYGTITNGSDERITLLRATAPIAGTFEIHETSVGDDGTMSMSEKDGGFEIGAGESFTLEPGGAHIMMFDIEPAEISGSIDLTFVFDSTEMTVEAAVREIGDSMDDMDPTHVMDGEEMDGMDGTHDMGS